MRAVVRHQRALAFLERAKDACVISGLRLVLTSLRHLHSLPHSADVKKWKCQYGAEDKPGILVLEQLIDSVREVAGAGTKRDAREVLRARGSNKI